jgi:hypothetical protein
MGSLPRKWIRRIAILFGLAGILTLALLELGWIPENQGQKAIIFLLSFIVLDGAARESSEPGPVPELVTNSLDYYHAMGEWVRGTKHELLQVIHGEEILRDELRGYLQKLISTVRSEKQLHCYLIVAARIADLSEESFQRRLALERDPLFEGRYHYRFIDAPVSFGAQVHDQKALVDRLSAESGGPTRRSHYLQE